MTAESGLKWLLRFIAATIIPAFFAAVMPQSWIVNLIHKAEPQTNVGILFTYFFRGLMAAYAYIGLQCLVFSFDINRYRPLIWILSLASLIVASIGLIVLFWFVPPINRTGLFWIVFADFAEGLAQAFLAAILLLRIAR